VEVLNPVLVTGSNCPGTTPTDSTFLIFHNHVKLKKSNEKKIYLTHSGVFFHLKCTYPEEQMAPVNQWCCPVKPLLQSLMFSYVL